ncbi:MAG: hypothetical protein JNM63_03295, partial [Spirochaetia bacterium]|nr:hypothetical protein [Spirochaetia bacterium]
MSLLRSLIFFVLIFILWLPAQVAVTGTIVKAESNTVIVRFPDLEAINTNQLMYVTSGGRVVARLRGVRAVLPRVEAKVLQGEVNPGDPVQLSMALSYENLLSPWDIDALVSYYKKRVGDLTAHSLDYEIAKVCKVLGVSYKDDLRTSQGMRNFLAKLYDATLKLSREERSAWHRYLLLLYRSVILEQPVDGLLSYFIQNEATASTIDDA